MRWRYRTILFEFHKGKVFGEKYIDEEEVENILNQQGAAGWELVSVSPLREGLLAFCKKPQHSGTLKGSGKCSVEEGGMKTLVIKRESELKYAPVMDESPQAVKAKVREITVPLSAKNSSESGTENLDNDLVGNIPIR
ncbi:MAG: DUF4177 domain-containing protein [Desulfobulbaceae bacterium]|nr:DUF4177 domain-containing protein [Desulfobulbaceae bacterium]